jgi:hypothetical protein
VSILTQPIPTTRTSFLLATILSGTACQTWRIESLTPEAVLATHHPAQVRVTRTDGSRIVVNQPVVRVDSLSGAVPRHGKQEDIRIPLADIQQVATRRFSAGKTLGLGVGLVAGGLMAVYLSACGTTGSGCNN